MDFGSAYIWLPVLAIGITLVVVGRVYAGRTRKQELVRGVELFGFRPIADAIPSRAVPLFRRGYSREFRNFFNNDSGVLLGDYSFRFGVPLIASLRYQQTVLLFPDNCNLRDFRLSPASLVDRAGRKFGLKCLRIDSAPEFSEHYLIRTDDETGVAAMFLPIVGQFQALDPKRKVFAEKEGSWLALYSQGVLITPATFPAFWARMQQIAGLLLPSSVISVNTKSR